MEIKKLTEINNLDQIMDFIDSHHVFIKSNEKHDDIFKKLVGFLLLTKPENLKNKNLIKHGFLLSIEVILITFFMVIFSILLPLSFNQNFFNDIGILILLYVQILSFTTIKITEFYVSFIQHYSYSFVNKKDFITAVLKTNEINEKDKYILLDEIKNQSEKHPEKHIYQILSIIYNDLNEIKKQINKRKKQEKLEQEKLKDLKHQLEIEKYM